MPEAHHSTQAEAGHPVSASPFPGTDRLSDTDQPSPDPEALPPAAGIRRTSYLPQLDGLRALAIVMVFLHHAYGLPLLWSGVDLFFILSGYLITNILVRDSARWSFGKLLGHFYLRRAQRILPAYLLCLVLIAWFTVQDWRTLWPFYAFFLQNVPYAFHKIGFSPLIPLWSLAVEQHFYLVWPFLVFFAPKRALAPCLLVLLIATPLLRALCTPLFAYPEAIYVLSPFRLDAMAAGALAAIQLPFFSRRHVLRWAAVAMAAATALYGVLSIYPWFRRSANTPAFNSLAYSLNILILGGLFLFALLAKPESLLYRVLSAAPMRFLGRISYAFYLLHMLVLMRFGPYFATRLARPACFVLTVLLAAASWYLLERPLLALGTIPKKSIASPAG